MKDQQTVRRLVLGEAVIQGRNVMTWVRNASRSEEKSQLWRIVTPPASWLPRDISFVERLYCACVCECDLRPAHRDQKTPSGLVFSFYCFTSGDELRLSGLGVSDIACWATEMLQKARHGLLVPQELMCVTTSDLKPVSLHSSARPAVGWPSPDSSSLSTKASAFGTGPEAGGISRFGIDFMMLAWASSSSFSNSFPL